MNYINPPETSPENVTHKTFFSEIYHHEIGYNIYLPPDYTESGENYPVAYHLHGWTGNESSDIAPMEKVCKSRRAITVFPNSSPVIEDFENLPVETMLINELIPYIDSHYRTAAAREHRSVSGFSMGAGMAFYVAIKYPDVFSSVTAYAGTYHHYYHKDYATVGVPAVKAPELYAQMMSEAKVFERSMLDLIKQNADKIRGNTHITLHIGTDDVLFCDNEILRLHLNALCIPHTYRKFYGVEHELARLVTKEQSHRGERTPLTHKGTVTLNTKRLILQPFKRDDLEQIYRNCWSDPDVWKWTSYEPMDNPDDVLTLNNIFTGHWFSKYEKLDYYNWAIRLASSGEVIGRIRGINLDDHIRQVELAYELGQLWWNQGMMTEAVNAVIDFFIRDIGFNRVYAAHAHENPASGKVMQKCGMVYEGTARQACICNNGTFNKVNYAMLAEDYVKGGRI